MTPKEKAKELVESFIPETRLFDESKGWVDNKESAKQCAVIACDQITLAMEAVLFSGCDYLDPQTSQKKTLIETTPVDYWQQVKKEIEAL